MTDPTEFSKLRGATGLTELAPILGFSARTLTRWESGASKPRASTLKVLSALTKGHVEPIGAAARFKFIDLFAGIGGFRLPFSRMEEFVSSPRSGISTLSRLANFQDC